MNEGHKRYRIAIRMRDGRQSVFAIRALSMNHAFNKLAERLKGKPFLELSAERLDKVKTPP